MRILLLTQTLPAICALFIVLYAFKFALMADINQGCIPSLFAITGIYIAIVFYISFKESLSIAKMVGLVLLIACVIVIALDKKENEAAVEGEVDLTESEKKMYGILSITLAIMAPLAFTFRAYFTRRTFNLKAYKPKDFGVDANLTLYGCLALYYIVFLATHEFVLSEFIEG